MAKALWLIVAAALLSAGPLQAADSGQAVPVTLSGNLTVEPAAAVVTISGSIEDGKAEPSPYWLGINVVSATPALRSQLGLTEKQGLVVEALVPGGPADKAGLKLYDVLMKADGGRLTGIADLLHAVTAAKEPKLTFDLIRGGKPQTVTVALGKRPEGWTAGAASPSDAGAMAKLLERMRREGGEGPVQFRFFRPGLILPPGAPLGPKLPENTSVVISRAGDKPAKIVVTQGGQKWEITEGEINKLPESLRPLVEQMLGRGSFGLAVPGLPLPGAERPDASRGEVLSPPSPGELRLEKRLDELSRQVDQLRKTLEKTRPAPAAPPANPPPESQQESDPPAADSYAPGPV